MSNDFNDVGNWDANNWNIMKMIRISDYLADDFNSDISFWDDFTINCRNDCKIDCKIDFDIAYLDLVD